MTDVLPRHDSIPPTPTVEVRVLRHGALLLCQSCDTLDEAFEAVEMWSEVPGTECEVA